ncbi:hypothetical protein [Thomasclavelia saccharogumia]|uniref:hypothetical protein n=1 Tax=Thomasclavelia saccharogumia TaxID=341225 RepID=UPI00047CD65B|nr:hypothetical protein [Thomasclavelia saccharogumia]
MDKIKKDFIVFYLMRNAVATFIITICSFVYDFMNYFNMTSTRAIIKIFSDNFYTTVYFLLLWILNYLLFEMYKIIIDSFRKENKEHAKVIINDKEVISYGTLLPLVILVILLLVKFNQLFRINFILLVLFMLLRSLKEEFKYHRNRLIK